MSKRLIGATVISLAGACLLLLGCASTGTAPQDRYYRLTQPDAGQPVEQPLVQGVLTVDRVRASGILRERALLYSLESSPEELKQYRYHHWTGTPPNMIRERLIAYLRKSNIAGHVAGDQTVAEADIRLKIKLQSFERIISDGGNDARVSLKLDVEVASNKRVQPIMIKSYGIVKPAPDKSMLASVRAMNEGLQEIYDQLLADLQKYLKNS